MVSLVIVSHTKKISEGIKELVEQMVGRSVRIAAVGGEEGKLGTEVSAIIKAIEEVYDENGVIIFVDFGSTLIGAKAALNLLDSEKRSRVYIANAPIVEGAFVAAVEASMGKDVYEILKVAAEARYMKKE